MLISESTHEIFLLEVLLGGCSRLRVFKTMEESGLERFVRNECTARVYSVYFCLRTLIPLRSSYQNASKHRRRHSGCALLPRAEPFSLALCSFPSHHHHLPSFPLFSPQTGTPFVLENTFSCQGNMSLTLSSFSILLVSALQVVAESHTISFVNKSVSRHFFDCARTAHTHRVLAAAELVLYVSLRNGRLLESDSAYAQPMLIQGANTLSSGQDYTSDGPLTSAIAYALAYFSPSNPDLIPLFCGVIGTFKLVAADSTGTPAHCLSST